MSMSWMCGDITALLLSCFGDLKCDGPWRKIECDKESAGGLAGSLTTACVVSGLIRVHDDLVLI